MARRLIGTGTTDSNGKVSVTYTGTGAGKLQLVAESGSLQSEIYGLIDAVLRDGGVTGDKNTNAFAYNTTYITVTTDSTGTTVENIESTSGNFRAFTSRNPTDNSYLWNGDFAIEFDIISSSSSNRIQLYVDNSNLISRTVEELGISNGGHLKIEYKDGVASYYVNNEDTPNYTRTLALSNYNIRVFLPSISTFTYKNFAVYPI